MQIGLSFAPVSCRKTQTAHMKSVSKKPDSSVGPNKVERLARNWQRCRPEILPSLFYAYDDEEKQSERLVTFRLPEESLEGILADVPKSGKFNLVVHLGVRDKFITDQIPMRPAFALFLQVKGEKTGDYDQCYELEWEKNSRFSEAIGDDTDSRANALSAAGAYLFVHSWMEMAELDLALPFTAISHVLGKRVQRYIFSQTESQSIIQDILDSAKPGVDIHLGNGLAVWEHPFSFRPVVEVKAATVKVKDRPMGRNTTGNTNDDGDSFYDFGFPDPPGEPD